VGNNWFDIDRKGLAKIVERRGKFALVAELISNALDADGVTRVDVKFDPVEGKPRVWITVADDAPEGFADLRHAWTVFAESSRKGNAEKRGRFNLGEKLVLALCEEASIETTTGGVLFDGRGRTLTRSKRERGSEFSGLARMTREELEEIRSELRKVIPPDGVTVTIEGTQKAKRAPLAVFEATLPTEIADDEGYLRRSQRKAVVKVYAVEVGAVGTLYELGIPVVETGDKFHVSVEQKIPLNMDRDNVTPAYLRQVRTLVVNHMHAYLSEADANTPIVNEALADEDVSPEAVNRALDLKYGEKRAIWDPSDVEANMNLVARGYTLIKGGQLTGDQWANAKKHDPNLKPAGQILPTKKALFSSDGEDRWVPREKWTPAMRAVVEYATNVGRELLGRQVTVAILSDVTQSYAACFGDQGLVFNLGRLGHAFFDACERGPTDALNRLLIHELGHGMPGGENHLAEEYHEGLCELGARLARLALKQPPLFQW